MNLHDQRLTYTQGELLESKINADPFAQFTQWYEVAKASNIKEANAMTLATASLDSTPSARIVLLKEITERGFIFYSNYDSRKGKEIAQNPQAQLLFFWDVLERQVRIEGRLERVSRASSEQYFYSRPVESQYGAMVSQQSAPIASREILEQTMSELQQSPPQMPPQWGGYILVPSYFEFWQGRPSRLHDRLYYQSVAEGWQIGRLAP